MGFTGTLEDVRILDVLEVLAITAQSGVLTVTRPGQRTELAFLDGAIMTAQLEPQRDHLAGYFLRRGWIDFATLHAALHRQAHDGCRLLIGQILMELGALSVEQLAEGLGRHVRAVLTRLLGWETGEFNFDTNLRLAGTPPGGAVPVTVCLDAGELHSLAEQARNAPEDIEALPPVPIMSDLSRLLEAAISPTPGRLVVLLTDDVLVRYGLEVSLHLDPFVLAVATGVDELDRILLESEDSQPTLIIDLDALSRSLDGPDETLVVVRRVCRQWPNVRLLSFGCQVPQAFYPLVQQVNVVFHLPRPGADAESQLETATEFVETLARLIEHMPRSLPPDSPAQQQMQDSERWRRVYDSILTLRGSDHTSAVSLEVLRFAADELERAVLLVMDPDTDVAWIQGMFGVVGRERAGTQASRNQLLLGTETVLRQVLKEKRLLRCTLADEDSSLTQLFAMIETPVRAEAYLVPLVVNQQVVAVVYADNGQSSAGLPPGAPLAVVAEHASQLLDNLALKRHTPGPESTAAAEETESAVVPEE
ncbi:MAG: DUF4388 domain-containing protein [Polyangiaceae bacterium]|nr:DUF4388 domain-containing protein [Polyangiaceae bacterium]